MSGGVTWEQIGQIALILAGILAILLGLGAAFAAGMASSPGEAENRIARKGFGAALAGVAVIAAVLLGFLP